MKKLSIIRTFILALLLLIAMVSNAQLEKMDAAYTFLKNNNLDSAKANIDAAVNHPETANEPQAWYVRGFVYKTIYSKNEKDNKKSPARLESLKSFKKALALDTKKEFYSDDVGSIKFLINTMHNDEASSLDPIDYKTAIELFQKEQEYYKLIDPSPENIQAREVGFSLALAEVYFSVVETNNKIILLDTTNVAAKKENLKFLTLTKNEYSKVLAIDPNNISANYQMAILYFNQAVNLIKSQDYDLDIVALDVIEDKTKKLFKESLPFMEKAYTLDPKRVETLQGMSGIYYGLNEKEKSNLYRQKLEDVKKPK
jgi:tetratricopeptide (TPR) repeat protein